MPESFTERDLEIARDLGEIKALTESIT